MKVHLLYNFSTSEPGRWWGLSSRNGKFGGFCHVSQTPWLTGIIILTGYNNRHLARTEWERQCPKVKILKWMKWNWCCWDNKGRGLCQAGNLVLIVAMWLLKPIIKLCKNVKENIKTVHIHVKHHNFKNSNQLNYFKNSERELCAIESLTLSKKFIIKRYF